MKGKVEPRARWINDLRGASDARYTLAATLSGGHNSLSRKGCLGYFARSSHTLAAPGPHLLKVSMVDPGIVLQKLIVSDTTLPESYFGPPESTPVD